MAEATKPYYGHRIVGGEGAYVLARQRFLLGLGPEPTAEGWGATPGRKAALDEVAQNLIERAREFAN
jgi:hypothetical protein